jgi:hypothetical protein
MLSVQISGAYRYIRQIIKFSSVILFGSKILPLRPSTVIEDTKS